MAQINADKAAIIKGCLKRGDPQMDIALLMQVNQGRIAEINRGTGAYGKRYRDVKPADPSELPPPGPYALVPKVVKDKAEAYDEIVADLKMLVEKYETLRQRGTDEQELRESVRSTYH